MKQLLCLGLFLPLFLFSHGSHENHNHITSKGGPLLNGYPWGIFDNSVKMQNRVEHTANDQELELANRIFEGVYEADVVAFPLFLENKGFKPFGDGQANAQANFKEWKKNEVPLIAYLFKTSSRLELRFHSDIINGVSSIKLRWPSGQIQEIPVSGSSNINVAVDINQLGWNSLLEGKTIFVKPSNWNDWFAIKFQNPNVSVEDLASSVPTHLKYKEIPNPLAADADQSTPPLLQLQARSSENGFSIFTTDKVHSIYPNPEDPAKVEKTVAGNWTFLLDPLHWQGQQKKTFKQLYSCFEGRAFWQEAMKKALSGTSWHHVGDPGEYILNSVKNEKRALVTAIGEKINLPQGITLAYGLDHIGYAISTKPTTAFISVKGQYHWHPVHTTEPICVEVWTPECSPNLNNNFGFTCP